MLSDEEKKAIKVLNHFNPVDCGREDTQAIETILNLIEKQSKEIEELNKSDESKEQSSMKYYNLYKELVDKIKAKIEELENQKRQWIEDRDNKHKDSEIIYAIEVLQSLLEKE